MLYVIYHGGCTDGFTAAWVAHLATDENKTKILPEYHKEWKTTNELLKTVTAEDSVLYFDICPPRALLLELKRLTTVDVYDHHLSSQKDCGDLPFVHIDQKMSGAGLAWKYYFPELLRPFFVELVEDNDLYKHEIPDCQAYIEFIYMLEKSYEVYTTVARIMENIDGRSEVLEKGKAYLEHTEYLAKRAANKHNILTTDIFEERLFFINSCFFQNQIADNLLEHTKAAGVFYLSDIGWKVSLRSSAKHDIDVSSYAEKFGGGGHKYAAAFIIPDLVKLALRPLTLDEITKYKLNDN